MEQISIGSVVKLKSGGPQMTVTAYGTKLKFGSILATNVEDNEQVKCQWFDSSGNSRTIQAKYAKTTLNKVNQTANEFRDKHIIQSVHNLTNQKQRVFLLVGGWHAIVCEPAFASIVR